MSVRTGRREPELLEPAGRPGPAEVPGDGGSIEMVVHARLRAVSLRCRQLLQVGAALGNVFALRDAAEMLRETTATLLPALEEALAAGLLVSTADHLAFGQELVWQVVADSIPGSARQALHREIGLMLVARGDRGDRGDPPGGSAVSARRLASAAPEAVDAHLASGHLASATALAAGALAQPMPTHVAAELRCRLAHILIMSGQAGQATALAGKVLAEPHLPAHVRENATAARVLALSLHDEPGARAVALSIVDGGERRQGDPAYVTAKTVLSNLAWDGGCLADSMRLARESVEAITEGTPSAWCTHARLALARKLSTRREFPEAAELIRQTQAEIDRFGIALHAAAPPIARARLLAQEGRIAEARSEAWSALSAAQELGAEMLIPLAFSVLATVALRSGDLLAAADHVRRYRAHLEAGTAPLWSVQYEWVEVLLAAEQDGPRRAAELLAGRFAGLARRPALFVEEPGAAAWLVRLGRAVGDDGLARAAVAAAETLAAANPGFPTLLAGAVHARALLHGDADGLRRAADEHCDPWAAAWAAEDLGLAGGPVAVATLETALGGFEWMGAGRDAARVRNHLRSLGVRRRAVGPGGGSSHGWDSLSETERTISHLVNQGLTNRQIAKRVFLSPHTVNYHLRQIFRKLSIGSRVDLARITQQHDTVRDDG
ncbi:LuxR C-terminal-related transcriptional regulator [Dactylosporangium sp. NPDC049525]|uniref:helix-turn-helix transcriptional regulator n=1 Tax=Dactylosporangium sp. NPDC049525 TaxID=3154730 RepID=UPI00344040C8